MQLKHGRRIASILLILVMTIVLAVPATVSAATVSVLFKGRNDTYYKRKDVVYVGDEEISVADTPIFLKSGTYVGPAIEILKNSTLGVKVTVKDKKKLILNYDGIKMVMTNGSCYAKVNGKKLKMGGPCMKVKYKSSGKARWLVPLLSTCKRLGLEYKLTDGVININEKLDTSALKKTEEEKPATTPSTDKPVINLVLDAGHGGSDSGARGNGLIEKNLTLRIVLAARSYFKKDPRFKVYYTRVRDTYPSLSARSNLANKKNVDFFISVHINSYVKTSTGTETLYNAKRVSVTKKRNLTSRILANYMHRGALASTGFLNRGLKSRPGLHVLRKTNMPACLLEYGFISNPKEAKVINISTSRYGKALYDSVVTLMKAQGKY